MAHKCAYVYGEICSEISNIPVVKGLGSTRTRSRVSHDAVTVFTTHTNTLQVNSARKYLYRNAQIPVVMGSGSSHDEVTVFDWVCCVCNLAAEE